MTGDFLRATRSIVRPAMEWLEIIRGRREARPGIQPELLPELGIAELGRGVGATSGDETGKVIAAGRLASRVVAQVNAAADIFAVIREGGMGRRLGQKKR